MSKPLHIAVMMTSSGWGGLELNTLKLMQGLNPFIDRQSVIVQENTRFSNEAKSLGYEGLFLLGTKKYFDFSNARRLARFIEANEIDVVLSIYRPDLDLLAWTKKRCKRPFRIIHQQQMQIGVPKKGWLQRHRYRAVDEWIAPLEWLREEVLEKTVVPASKISIIPLGVESAKFLKRTYSQEDAREVLDCRTTNTLMGVIGRIDEKKGQLLLIQALQQLRSKGMKVELLIVGEPTINDPKGALYYEQILDYIVHHQLENVVHFSGFTNDVARFYNAIDVFVMSSQGETYGMVTLEALLSGLPVIGTNTGGTPELLGHGERGELYDYRDVESFVSAYERLQERLQNGGLNPEAIRHEIAEKYDLSVEVEGVLALLKKGQLR